MALPIVAATVAALFYSAVSIFRHDRFGSSGFDLGIFDQTIWGYSRFEVVRNTVKGTPNLLGDHFHPGLMLLAPAYWIWNDARVLLVAQAFLLAAASLPIFYWGRRQLGTAAGAVAQLAFLVFWGVLAGAIVDFHELALAVPAISFGLWALLERRTRLFVAMLVLGCLAKEDIALTFAAMGIYALVVQRRWRFGLVVVATCLAWFAFVLDVVIPEISERPYHYWDYPALGRNWTAAAVTLLERPYRALTLALDRTAKVTTLLATFGAWLFLPLASPLLLVALPALGERFWAQNPTFWSTGYQYSLPVAPVLAFAAIDGARRLGHRSRQLVVAAAATGIVLSAFVVRPLEVLGDLMSAHRAALSDSCLDAVPPGASVAASERLIPHLSHRLVMRPLTRESGETYFAVAHDAPATDQALLRRALAGRPIEPRDVRYRLVCRLGAVSVLEAAPPAVTPAARLAR
ncbi:MAG: DUF2079 domain-containing protein [Gaiellaceae bacterium]